MRKLGQNYFAPFSKRYSEMEEFTPSGANSFLFFIVDHFSKEDWCTKKQTGRHKNFSLVNQSTDSTVG